MPRTIPSIKQLNKEYQNQKQIKKTLQKEYLQNKSEYREMINATTNINMLIGMDRTKAYDKQR